MNRQWEPGCLLVEDPLDGQRALQPLQDALIEQGIRIESFIPQGLESIYEQLQNSYQRIRRDEGLNGIIGTGYGCDCALALAGQLPVDRLVLLNPLEWHGGEPESMRRLRRYARRGAAFCVTDLLVIPGLQTPAGLIRWFQRSLCNSRLTVAEPVSLLGIKREERFIIAILHFLRHGVLPKSLAENEEMCIIYG